MCAGPDGCLVNAEQAGGTYPIYYTAPQGGRLISYSLKSTIHSCSDPSCFPYVRLVTWLCAQARIGAPARRPPAGKVRVRWLWKHALPHSWSKSSSQTLLPPPFSVRFFRTGDVSWMSVEADISILNPGSKQPRVMQHPRNCQRGRDV